VAGDPAEQLLRRLHDQAALACEVTRAQDRERIVGERRRHLRTIRSAARSRNRGRPGLAWLIVLALSLLILAATRAAAAPNPTVPPAPVVPSVPPPGSWGVVVDELDDDEDSEEAGDDAPTDDSFDYLQDFDLERGDAIQRLVDLEAAALVG
jgi:hypothetical protein